ncbi:MAG: hypothetical protein LC541_08000 [Candidatus Thiodiazotropha sp.]|nr:hypothetical protein [Candidatus Thiodiazotropha sp.]MCM8883223.1 hypothetical protein [Candidatus Thiodiazotropha sp.]MCM8920619.1 hypothetical protein [Candidatus Thiodiazotropha sp.]
MKNHFLSPILLFISLSVLFPVSVSADCPPCGPDFCKNESRYPVALSSKKQRLLQHDYPEYLVNLLDKGSACVARVERSPDGFSIQRVMPNGNWTISSWSADGERKADQDLIAGRLKSFAMFNNQHAFACCGDPDYKERQDYDYALDINKSIAIVKN